MNYTKYIIRISYNDIFKDKEGDFYESDFLSKGAILSGEEDGINLKVVAYNGFALKIKVGFLKNDFEVAVKEKFADYIANDFTEMALAYESVWLEQMSKHGLIGIGANIILMVYSIFVVPRKFKSKEMLWLSLAYWGIYTMTSVPTFRTSLFYLLLIYYIKSSEMYKEKAMKGT